MAANRYRCAFLPPSKGLVITMATPAYTRGVRPCHFSESTRQREDLLSLEGKTWYVPAPKFSHALLVYDHPVALST